MPEFNEFPDLEAACSDLLRDGGVDRVYSSIPARPIFPLAVVERLGGVPPIRYHLDAARIQVSVYGNNKGEARDEAELARRVLLQAEGTTVEAWEAVITGVDDETGLTWLPDPETARDRYVFGLIVTAHKA
jgi:hypothetical protein